MIMRLWCPSGKQTSMCNEFLHRYLSIIIFKRLLQYRKHPRKLLLKKLASLNWIEKKLILKSLKWFSVSPWFDSRGCCSQIFYRVAVPYSLRKISRKYVSPCIDIFLIIVSNFTELTNFTNQFFLSLLLLPLSTQNIQSKSRI